MWRLSGSAFLVVILAHWSHLAPSVRAQLPGDYNGDGVVDADDINLQRTAMSDPMPDLTLFDENGDGQVNYDDRLIWVHDHAGTWIGDSNLDGQFDTFDLVRIFTVGIYESGEMTIWQEGDWDGNLFYESGDFVAAFVDGGFLKGKRSDRAEIVPEPAGWAMLIIGFVAVCLAALRKSV